MNDHFCRYNIFCLSTSNEKSLPPTKDALTQHTHRVSYQAAIWRRATSPNINCPAAAGHGWNVKDGKLGVVWMTQPPAPRDILQTTQCACKKGCKTNCSCVKAQLPCTPLCGHSSCGNNFTQSDDDDDGDDDGPDSEPDE